MALFELLVVSDFLLWSFFITILSIVAAALLWQLTDERVAEAATTKVGAETPLRWDMGIKNFLLSILAGFTVLISGASLGQIAAKTVAFFDEYGDDKTEAITDYSNSTTDRDDAGTAATFDLLYHMIGAFYG